LTLEEFSQRVEAAYAAKTADELAHLTTDLPAPAQLRPAPAQLRATGRRSKRFTISIFGGFDHKGRWRSAQSHWVISIFGGSDLDFRQASLEGGAATVYVLDVFGGTDLYVPEGVDVDLRGIGIFGGADEHGRDSPPHVGAPVLRVRAFSLFGGTDLWRVPGGTKGGRKDLRQASRAAEREEPRN
jgi:Domain of unknown function (DUF1707)/Cell wall-active antibiotics response 4TMS YvqF